MNRRAVNRLHDALKFTEDVREWTQHESLETYVSEPMVRYPVERQLKITGVAFSYAQKADRNVVDEEPDVERWKRA